MIIFLRSLIYSTELLSAMSIESYPFGSNPKNSAVDQEYNEPSFQQALKLSAWIGESRGEGSCLGYLGMAHSDLGQSLRSLVLSSLPSHPP